METGTKIAIGVGAAAVVGFGIYWFFIREGEDAAAAITGTKPINEMTPAELKAMGGGKLNITQSVLDLLTPEQKAALKSAGTVIKTIKEEVVTPETATTGEESKIDYISPPISGGKVRQMDQIGIKILDGVFKVGDVIKLNHPRYKGTYDVVEIWDAPTGGGAAFINTPFIDTGERDAAPYQMNPIDKNKTGTVAIIGESSNEELSASGGKNRRVRFLGKAEAKLRKQKKSIGTSQGKKGAELRRFIRTGNEHVMPKNPKTFVKKQSAEVLKRRRRGADGSVSWNNAHGYIS